VITGLSGICAVPVVHEELERGVDDHPYFRLALGFLDDAISVARIPATVTNREEVVSIHLDPGEPQAFDRWANETNKEPFKHETFYR